MKKAAALFFAIVTLATARAQKLPSIQYNSVRSPSNIKIDGNIDDWGGKFQAYNSACRLFYTVANDSENLYLVLKMDGRFATSKALQGGLTFTIMPLYNKAKRLNITYNALPVNAAHDELSLFPSRYAQLVKDSVINRRKMDSLILAANSLIAKNFKQILVNGIAGVEELLISIYNKEGLLISAKLNNYMEYTCELALPLRLLSSFITPEGVVKYNIKVNPHPVVKSPGPNFAPPMLKITDNINFDSMYVNNATDFSGEYTLAKEKRLRSSPKPFRYNI